MYNSVQMKPLLVLPILYGCASLALAQTTVDYGHIAITAQHQERDGVVVRCRGQVEIATGNTLLYADEAEFNSSTREIELHGNVHVKLLPAAHRTAPLQSPPPPVERLFRLPLNRPEIWK
jgi:hypothetical protein